MILYVIWVSLIWTILMIPYMLFYRNQSFFVINRVYLLTSILLGLIIPLIPNWNIPNPYLPTSPVQYLAVQLQEITITSKAVGTLINVNIIHLLFAIYLMASIISLVQFIKSLMHIKQLFPKLNLLKKEVQIHYSDTVTMPFSFLNTIVLPKKYGLLDFERTVMISHENAHITNKHYVDIFFIQILLIVFPFHPIIYWYRKELKLVHEFQADQDVLRDHSADQYAKLLIHLANTTPINPLFIHSFASSHLKIRIMMFANKYSFQHTMTYVLIPFLFLFCFSCFSQHDKGQVKDEVRTLTTIDTLSIFNPETNIEQLKIVQDNIEYHTLPDNMPEFPGGDAALMKYISSNLVYPEQMKKNKKEGTTILTFIIDEVGQLKHPSIIKSISQEFDEAARNCMFNLAQNFTWKPGMIKDKPVNVIYTLPIKFKFE